MVTKNMSQIEKEVWQTVQALNRAWTSNNVEALKDYFHKDMVAIPATDRERLEGKGGMYCFMEGIC